MLNLSSNGRSRNGKDFWPFGAVRMIDDELVVWVVGYGFDRVFFDRGIFFFGMLTVGIDERSRVGVCWRNLWECRLVIDRIE